MESSRRRPGGDARSERFPPRRHEWFALADAEGRLPLTWPSGRRISVAMIKAAERSGQIIYESGWWRLAEGKRLAERRQPKRPGLPPTFEVRPLGCLFEVRLAGERIGIITTRRSPPSRYRWYRQDENDPTGYARRLQAIHEIIDAYRRQPHARRPPMNSDCQALLRDDLNDLLDRLLRLEENFTWTAEQAQALAECRNAVSALVRAMPRTS